MGSQATISCLCGVGRRCDPGVVVRVQSFTPVDCLQAPFMNVIYDKDPIGQWVYGRVALIGEALTACPAGQRLSCCYLSSLSQPQQPQLNPL